MHELLFASLLLLSAEKTAYQSKTVIDFSDVKITADVVRPEATYVRGKRRLNFRPLIRNRGDFRPELEKSLDQL